MALMLNSLIVSAAPTIIDTCTIIDKPGDYELTADIIGNTLINPLILNPFGAGWFCIGIASSDVNLNCNGYSIDRSGPGLTGLRGLMGIYLARENALPNGGISNVSISNCKVINYEDGIYFDDGVNHTQIIGNTVKSNYRGILVQGSHNTISYNTVKGNYEVGIRIYGGTYSHSVFNTVSLNSISWTGRNKHERGKGISLGGVGVNKTSIYLNKIYDNVWGIYVADGSSHNDIGLNEIYKNERGVFLRSISPYYYNTGNNFLENSIRDNVEGVFVQDGLNALFHKNKVYGNDFGFAIVKDITNSHGDGWSRVGPISVSLKENEIYNNKQGFNVTRVAPSGTNSLFTMSEDHFYNNDKDLVVDSGNYGTIINDTATDMTNNYKTYLLLNKVVFDSPPGKRHKFTTLSMLEDLDEIISSRKNDFTYSISWSNQPAPTPIDFKSFADKFISVETTKGSPQIDKMVWHWKDSEVGNIYKENSFDIYNYFSSWNKMPATLDITTNTLTLNNLIEPHGVYGILEFRLPRRPGPCTLSKLSSSECIKIEETV